MQAVWAAALPKLQQRLGERNFAAWIAPIRCAEVPEGEELRLEVPNSLFSLWIEQNFRDTIQAVVEETAGRPYPVRLVVRVNGKNAQEPPRPQRSKRPAGGESSTRRRGVVKVGHLVEDYTFERFVVGPTNAAAVEAAQAAVRRPGGGFNPILIHGGVGLGKTHLINAVGHALLERHPRAQVACVPAETFANLMIQALRRRGMDGFRERFRRLDALILDDVQFLAGKEAIQEEFVHTFEAIFGSRRQVVLTSDRPPAEIARLEARLRSRFDGGVTVGIAPPTREMRLEITARKARELGMKLPDQVVELIADRCGPTVRELEGALSCLLAQARVSGAVTLELAQEVLSRRCCPRRVLTVDDVIAAVARDVGVAPRELLSRQRERRFARARQAAMYLARELTGDSLPAIGRKFGGRDHSTVVYAVRAVEQRRSKDKTFDQWMERLAAEIQEVR